MKPYSRAQQKATELCSAGARALSGEPGLHVRGDRLYWQHTPLPIPAVHLHPAPPVPSGDEATPFTIKRGQLDAIALHLRYSNRPLHRQLAPQPPVARLIFDLLEQFRIEAIVPDHLPGVRTNLTRHFSHWAQLTFQSGLTETQIGNLLYTLVLITRSRLHTIPVPEYAEFAIEATRAAIVPVIGTDLAGLKRQIHNQEKFAIHACAIADTIHAMIDAELAQQAENSDASQPDNLLDKVLAAFPLLLSDEALADETLSLATSGESKAFTQHHQRYQVYTRQYDEEVQASSLVRDALLVEFRDKLDEKIRNQGINLRHLSRQLAAALNPPQRNGWTFGEEEGRIDGRRLSQLISSPSERRLFCQERYPPTANAIVSFLIDCSGSMRDHSEKVALMIDVMVRALGMAGISSEVLGFTTQAWNGGRAYSDWLRQGRPAYPGRLSEIRHLIFKPAERHWRHARKEMAALLKADLFKEGIDGEAVEWACQRLRARPEARRFLLVLSDGCPMDTATNLTNDKFYLDNHLKAVVEQQQRQGDVAVLGIGLGLDLSPYYRQNLAIGDSLEVNNRLLADIVTLLAGARR